MLDAPATMTAMPVCEVLIGHEERGRSTAIARGLAPRLDYRIVANSYPGIVHQWAPSPSGYRGLRIVRAIRSVAGNLRHALHLVRSLDPHQVVYATGETWGIPVALVSGMLRRRFVHVVYVHRMYAPGWQWALPRLSRGLHVDGWICVNRYQAELLRSVLTDSASQVTVIPQGVDTLFYDPARANAMQQAPYVLSVGAEMRNYALFLDAVRRLSTPVVLKASSTWMRQMREMPRVLPPNVTLLERRLSYVALRDLYGGASVVVVPLHDTPQAAGITTILEAMSMGQPVVVTRSRGLPDGLVSGDNCIIVEPDPDALSLAIAVLLEDPAELQAMGRRGRRFVMDRYRLEHHACQVVDFLQRCADASVCTISI